MKILITLWLLIAVGFLILGIMSINELLEIRKQMYGLIP